MFKKLVYQALIHSGKVSGVDAGQDSFWTGDTCPQRRPRSRNMRKTALRRMQSVHTVGTTISVTISM